MRPQFLNEELFIEADALIKENSLGEAVNTLERILADDPSFGKAYNHLGFIYETKFQDYIKAEEFYILSLKHQPNYVSAYYNYAYLLSILKRYDDLKRLLDTALTIPGINQGTIYNELGIMNESLCKYDLAIENYENAIRNYFDNNMLETAINSIERCKKKIDLFRKQ